MATAAMETTDTRTRLIEVAIDLFTRHSFAGTSLQMIADELGFTKAAIYHHFRTREQLLAAVLEPMLDELRTVVESAETQTHGARAGGAHAQRLRRAGGAEPGTCGGACRRPQCRDGADRARRMGRPDQAAAGAAR